MDFNVTVNAEVKGLTEVESLEKKIELLSKTPHKINLNVDFSGQDVDSLLKGLSNGSGIANAGKKAGIQFSKGFSAAKFTPDIIDYGKIKKKNKKEIENISKDMQKGLSDVTSKDTDQWAKQYVSDRNKAYKQSVKEYTTEFKNLKTILKQIGDYDVSIEKLDPLKNSNEINELILQREKLEQVYSKGFSSFLDKSNNDPLVQEVASMEKLIELDNIYEKSQNKIAQIKAKQSDLIEKDRLDDIVSDRESAEKILSKAQNNSYQAEISKYKSELDKFKSLAKTDNRYDESIKIRDKMESIVSILMSDSANNFSSSLILNYDKQFTQLGEKLKNNLSIIKNEYGDFDKIQNKFTEASSKLSILSSESFNEKLSKYSNTSGYQKITDSIEKASAAKERLNAEMAKGSNANIDNINADLKIMQSELKKADTQWDKLNSSVSKIDAVKAGNSTLTWLKNNSKAAKDYGEALEDLAQKQKSATTAGELEAYTKQVQMIKSDATAKGLIGKSPLEEAKRAISQIGQFVGVYGVLQQIPEIGKQMVQSVYDVDTAMTNLYKVTDETATKYNEFLGNSGKSAQELGRSMSSLITQTSEWAKLGFSLDESSTLSKISSIYANVGEVDDKTSVSDLVTAMKAYNIEANNAMSIVDSMNILGNEFATSSGDLGEGLSNAASSLSSAGNDINQSLAMLTGMSEITQSAGESGNALKILSMRLRGYDEETESYSNDIEELTGKVADLTKTVDTPGGISLFTDDTKETYKSTYQIIEEISKIWDKLTDKSRAELTEVLAGKNRGNQISALMQAFQSGQVQKAYNASVNSEGSAMEEQNRWLESMEAKIGQFQAAFQQLSNTSIDSDFLKGFIDIGTGALNLLDSFIDKAGILQTLIGGFSIGKGIASFAKNFD